MPGAISVLSPRPSSPARLTAWKSRLPSLLVAPGQTGAVHAACDLLEQEGYTLNRVQDNGDVLARMLREENRHFLLVTGSMSGAPSPFVSAPELITQLREIGYRGCVHLRAGFLEPHELDVYQQASVGYIMAPIVGRDSFLDDVRALTAAAPAGVACLSVLQLESWTQVPPCPSLLPPP